MDNGYQLSRAWFDFCFENPELISPNHSAIYFFAIEHCNRLGWKDKFGFPTQMTMDAIGIKKHQTYIRYFNDLVNWGFLKLIQKSTNQYSANIISLKSAKPKSGKALDKAFIKHAAKQIDPNGQSNSSIDKQDNNITKEQINNGLYINTVGKTQENFILIVPKEIASIKTRINGEDGLVEYVQSSGGALPLYSEELGKKFMRNYKGKEYEGSKHLWNDWNKFTNNQ